MIMATAVRFSIIVFCQRKAAQRGSKHSGRDVQGSPNTVSKRTGSIWTGGPTIRER